MSEIARTIDGIIRDGLAPALKEEGYKKKGRNFLIVSKEVIRVVNVQASQWNVGNSGRFTLNLGIHLPRIAKFTGNEINGQFPKEYECTVRKRIGRLMPQGKDHWWEIGEDTDALSLSLEVADVWKKLGSAWINQPWDRFDFLEKNLAKEGNDQAAIAAHLLQKNMKGAKEVLKKAVAEYRQLRQENAERWIREWAAEHKVTLE
jgi:hypothetical protein